ncbi:CPBP family intramembrane glutamic endopeptidase [Mycetocola saprophilus]|uniref:CPBP family intramembrane glutamic endopeptidase n=1 Tax=Mycetocola saprophilus TaxID=76636 RepID=UPI0004C284AD|nr:CPBP family intramembrane glutamic endopeptidase [Mycetocola saprophilus]
MSLLPERDAAFAAPRRRLGIEIGIVLALSLGASALYSILTLISRLTAETSLGNQSAGINQATSTREWLDFTNQFLGFALGLAPVALVLYLLWRPGSSPFAQLGLDVRARLLGRDFARGLFLVAVIGVPGIALYAVGRLLGITVAVQAAPPDQYWWTIPMLILAALKAGLLEEVIVIGYLYKRLDQLGWGTWKIIIASALLRGSYHLYQGIGPFFGNVVMGVVFGWCYRRWGRVMPLVIAHTLIDIISFVGYPLALAWWPGIFGVSK